MNAQLPAHLARYQSRDLGSTLSQNLGAASPPYVSIAGGRFTLIDAAGNEAIATTMDPQLGVYLDACIIDVGDHISRVYYEKDYDPSAQTFSPPDCWSDNGVGPSTQCSKPQAATCAACQWSVWGSAISAQGKQIPACQQVQKIALIVPAHPQAVFLLRVPPNSHKHLRAYNELSKRSGVDISNVVTRIYFDRTTQGTLLFSGVTWIDEAVAAAREAAYAEKKTDVLVGRNDVARAALAAPAAQPLLAPAQGSPVVGAAPLQQVQPSAPFAPSSAPAITTAQPAASVPMQQAPVSGTVPPTAQPASPSNPAAPPQRRRRRTAAEMAAANAAPAQPAQPAAAPQNTSASSGGAAPQAPFPHPGQQAQPQQTDLGFGMSNGQPAAANPELTQALDSFFQT